jgi:hypothetical protein
MVVRRIVVTVVAGAALLGCSGGGGGAVPAPADESVPASKAGSVSSTTLPLIDIIEFEEDVCVPSGGGGPVVTGGVPGADPYALSGARQRPGPAMTTRPLDGAVRSVAVARPGDPDANSPAKVATTVAQVDAAASVPAATQPTPTVASTSIALDDQSASALASASDSDCVALP